MFQLSCIVFHYFDPNSNGTRLIYLAMRYRLVRVPADFQLLFDAESGRVKDNKNLRWKLQGARYRVRSECEILLDHGVTSRAHVGTQTDHRILKVSESSTTLCRTPSVLVGTWMDMVTWWHVLLKHLEISWNYVVLLMFLLFPFSSFLIFWLCWTLKDLKCFVFSLIGLHFRIKPVWGNGMWHYNPRSNGNRCQLQCSHSRLKIVPEAVKMLQQLN